MKVPDLNQWHRRNAWISPDGCPYFVGAWGHWQKAKDLYQNTPNTPVLGVFGWFLTNQGWIKITTRYDGDKTRVRMPGNVSDLALLAYEMLGIPASVEIEERRDHEL